MGSKKLKSLVAVATLASTLPVATHQANITNNNTVLTTKHNNQSVNSNVGGTPTQLDATSSTSSNQNIDYAKDLQINVSNISMQKESTGSNNPNTDYKPENNVPASGDIVTQGTVVSYQISVSLRSKTGKLYPVSSASLSADPIVSYMNSANETPQEKAALQQLQQSIQAQLGTLKNLNSTSTFVITASFNIGEADWNVKMIPNIKINLKTPDNKTISIPIDVKPLKETIQYTDNVQVMPSLSPDSNDKHTHYMTLGLYNQVTPYSPGVYSPENQKPKTVTFTINNPDPKDITITPLDVPGLVKNSDGTYTAPAYLLNSNKNLFKLTTTTNSQLRVPITVTPVKEDLQSPVNGIDSSVATKMQYNGGQAILKQRDFGDHFSMTQSSETVATDQPYGNSNYNQVIFGSTMTTGVPGKYNVYTGSLVSNGEIVVKNSNAPQGVNLINSRQVYCHLNDNAVNILKNGTPAQKAQIMEDIVSGNMNGIGTKYTADELQTLMNEGKTVPALNFTYVEKGYNGSNFSEQSTYITTPTNGNENPVISRTITFGDLQGSYSPDDQKQMADELKGGQLPSDGVVENNGKLQGFILTPPNSYTDSDVKAKKISRITDERYGDYSHGLSAAYNGGQAQISVTADSFGSSTANTVSTVKYSWFSKPHQFSVNIQGYGDGPSLMMNNTTITVDMGHSFKLIPGQPVQFGGYNVPASDVKVEGNKLVVKLTPQIAQSLSSAPDLQFNAQYTNPSTIDEPIVLGATLSGPDDSDGMVYQYNNKEVPAAVDGMPQLQYYNTKIVVSKTISNDCLHYETAGKDNTVTLGDVITNNNKITKTYYIAGEIPVTGANNLPGKDGEPSTGDLGSELQSLSTNGVPTWVLPKSAMNAQNEKILTSPIGTDLKDQLSYIESPNSGWVKYTPGMDLKNVVGYFVTPTVGPRGSYTMTYNIKLTNVGKGEEGVPQVVNSQFKYYDATDKIGSTSNIVNITPPGTNVSNSWVSTVKEVDGGKLTPQDLSKTTVINGKVVSLKDLIGNGPDLDANFDPTPTKLMNEVTLSQEKEALAKLGYQLVNITVNGKVRDLSWFQNEGISDNTGLTEVVFNIKKLPEATTTVKEVYSNGKPVVADKTTTNEVGNKVDTEIPSIPQGYQITKVTVNGQQVDADKVPTTQSKENQTIVYTIGKVPTDTVKVFEGDKQIGNIVSVTGKTGTKTGLQVPTIPEGYHVVSETINGKPGSGVPDTFGNSNVDVVYHIAKNVVDKTYGEIVDKNGTVLVPQKELNEGKPGSKTAVQMPQIPEGYKIVGVTVNGQSVQPNKDGHYDVTYNNDENKEVDNKIVVTVEHEPVQDTVKVEMPDGKTYSSKLTIPGMLGTSTGITTPDIPAGYHIDKITVDGKVSEEAPKTYGSKDSTVVYHLVQNKSNDIVAKVVTTDGTVLTNNTVVAEGPEGTTVDTKSTPIPNNYHLVKVMYNGKEISTESNGKVVYTLPNKIESTEGKLVYVVAPNTSTVNVQVTDGTQTFSNKTTNGNVGTPVNDETPSIPKGYKVTNITVNGHTVSEKDLPKVYGKTDTKVVYHVTKIPTGVVDEKVITEDGTVIVKEHEIANGEIGQDIKVQPYTAPKGYHIVKVLVDGKEIDTKDENTMIHNLPNTINRPQTQITYVLAQDAKQTGKITIYVQDQSGHLIGSPKTYSGVVGSNTPNMTPSIPEGDTVTSITNGNTVITSLPKTFTDGSQNIVYHVNVSSGKLTYIININGHEVKVDSLTGKSGDTASYDLPHNSHLQLENITVNGKEVPSNPDYHGEFSHNGTVVVYNYKTVTPSENTPNTPSKDTPSKDTPAKPADKTPAKPADKTPATPSKETPSHEGDKTPAVKPVTPSKDTGDKGNTPVAPSHEGDKTPVKPADKTPDVKPATPSHEGDKTPDVKPVEPSKETPATPSKDGNKTPATPSKETPNKDGNKTPDVKPATPSKETPATPSKETPVKPATPSKETPVKPATPSKDTQGQEGHKETPVKPDVKPATPSKETPDVKPATPSKEGDKTPAVKPVEPSKGTPSKDTPSKETPATPSKEHGDETHNNGDKKPSIPSKETPATPNHDGHKEVKPSTPGKDTDSKGNNEDHKEVKPSTPVNHDGDKTPEVKPSTPNHEGNKTPEVKPSTPNKDVKPSTPSKDETGKDSHEGHKEVKPSAPSKNTDSKGNSEDNKNVKPVEPSKTTPVKPSTPADHKEVKPSTPSKSENKTQDSKSDKVVVDNNKTTSHSDKVVTNNTTAEGTTNNSGSSKEVNTLPHTGLSSNGVDNVAKEAGALAGMFAAIAGLFVFRKRK